MVPMSAMKVMNSEAPSSAPRMGRKESERNSKRESSQATLPRGPLARSAALVAAATSAALAPRDISGSAWMSLKTFWTPPPMTTWKRSPVWGTAPMTPGIASIWDWSIPLASRNWNLSLVAQCVRETMLPGPPTPRTISLAVDSDIPAPLPGAAPRVAPVSGRSDRGQCIGAPPTGRVIPTRGPAQCLPAVAGAPESLWETTRVTPSRIVTP